MAFTSPKPTVLSKTAAYTASVNDGDNVHINVDASAGAVTITLYAASGNSGKTVTVKKTDSGSNAVTVDGNASETLDGQTTLTLSSQYDAVTLLCDGSNWHRITPAVGNAATQTFRGLQLRTSSDADLAATWVQLVKADEIVMHDGARVADWSNLYANVALSGAGGLDTGTEGASRWYEIYAIRKSSDGTKNLLLHRAKSYDLDQSLSAGDDGSRPIRFSSTPRTAAGQGFTPAVSGPRPFIDAYLIKTGSPTGRIWAELRSNNGGVPSSTVLATSDKLDVSAVSTTSQWVRFIFRSPVTLTAGTLYHIVITGDWTQSDANYVAWRADDSSPPYAGGTASIADNTPTWTTVASDHLFKDYVTANDTAVTMPTGYDQRCLIGYAYNDGSSNFRPFWQQGRNVYHYATVLTSGLTSTTATLIDMSTQIPPVPVTGTKWQIANSLANNDTRFGSNPTSATAVYEPFGVYYTAAVNNFTLDIGAPIPLECQHLYACVGGGSGTIYIKGFQW